MVLATSVLVADCRMSIVRMLTLGISTVVLGITESAQAVLRLERFKHHGTVGFLPATFWAIFASPLTLVRSLSNNGISKYSDTG
jgi:hypothetical protein